jgi:hypothetical protein
VRYQLTQPLIVENTGGRPCVLAGVELDEPWFGAGNWFTEGVSLRDVVVPRVLNPRDPVIARLVFDRSAYGTSPRGDRYDLAEALEALRLVTPPDVRVKIAYAAGGRTRHYVLTAQLNSEAQTAAFESAQERARFGGDDEVDLTLPGDA